MQHHCHACDAPMELERVGRRDACVGCGADLHVCKNCAHHDPFAQNQCREPGTEPVRDREASNFCDAFEFRTGKTEREGGLDAARAKLDALFKK